jgi:hypothetical protein
MSGAVLAIIYLVTDDDDDDYVDCGLAPIC